MTTAKTPEHGGAEFQDRTAVITGGATGMGLAIARNLGARGASIVIASRDRARGEKEAEDLRRTYGACIFVRTDVTSRDSVETTVGAVIEHFGSIEILVNNSGLETQEGPEGPSEHDWDRMFAVNAKGTWLCCKSALPHLLRVRGVIINNASMAALVGVAGSAGYAASKAAVVSLTRSLALAYADQGLRVNAICPGPVETQMTYDEWDLVGGADEGRGRAFGVCPARRIASPDEIAELVAYLASDRAAFITGAAVPIDGGKTSGLMPVERYRW